MEQTDPQERMRALAVARRPVEEWIAGAHALALLHGALQAGILEAARTPSSPAAIAAACGLAPEQAVDLCAALEAHGVLRRQGNTYQLADAFALLASPESPRPLPASVAGAVAEARLLEAAARPGQVDAALPPADRLALAQGATPPILANRGAGEGIQWLTNNACGSVPPGSRSSRGAPRRQRSGAF